MNFEQTISTVITSIIGLAIVAVIVSQRANSAKVINAAGGSLAGLINAAVSPVTGGGGGNFPTALPNLLGNGTFGAPN